MGTQKQARDVGHYSVPALINPAKNP
jgi:hypothetical protein